jgi:O-antigen/teichoic acid export membrane protein
LVAKWLDVYDYGRMVFLLGSFTAMWGLVEMGTTNAFFTLISQKTRSKSFIKIFLLWIFSQFSGCFLLLYFIMPVQWMDNIWHGEEATLIYLAMVCSFLQGTVWSVASKLADASRKTLYLQCFNVGVVFCHLVVLMNIWYFGLISIHIIFVAIIFEWALASYFVCRLYDSSKVVVSDSEEIERADTIKSVFCELLLICVPFIPYALFSFAKEFGDRWILQNWGGGVQQGYFGVGERYAGIVLIGASSIIRVFWKEIAEADYQGDVKKVIRLYNICSRSLFVFCSIVACVIVPLIPELVRLTLGDSYSLGVNAICVMLVYPIFQSLIQLQATFFYAILEIKTYVTISCFSFILGVPVSLYLISDQNFLFDCLGLGAFGLSIKLVLVGYITTNIFAWYASRLRKVKFDFFFRLLVLSVFCFFGFVLNNLFMIYFSSPGMIVIKFISGMLMFVILLVTVIIRFPFLMGLDRSHLKSLLNNFRSS